MTDVLYIVESMYNTHKCNSLSFLSVSFAVQTIRMSTTPTKKISTELSCTFRTKILRLSRYLQIDKERPDWKWRSMLGLDWGCSSRHKSKIPVKVQSLNLVLRQFEVASDERAYWRKFTCCDWALDWSKSTNPPSSALEASPPSAEHHQLCHQICDQPSISGLVMLQSSSQKIDVWHKISSFSNCV